MPACQSCSYTWSWGEVTKKSFTTSSYMKCPECEEKQYPTARSRKLASGSSFVFIALIMFISFYMETWIAILALFLPFFLIQVAIYPWYLTLSNEEESLF